MCCCLLKVKSDMWSKMISQEEYMMTINNFLNRPEVRILLISITSSGLLVPTNTFPESFKTKTIYFIKRQVVPFLFFIELERYSASIDGRVIIE